MDKLLSLETFNSFPSRFDGKKNESRVHMRCRSEIKDRGSSCHLQNNGSSSVQDLSPSQVLDEVDRILDTLSSSDDGPISEVPQPFDTLYSIVEYLIVKYESRGGSAKFGQDEEDHELLSECLKSISNLINKMDKFSSDSKMASSLNKASILLQRAMCLLDEDFRTLLENKRVVLDPQTLEPKPPSSSFGSHPHDSDRCVLTTGNDEPREEEEEEFPDFSTEAISTMSKIATAMISSGYENECCYIYSICRRNAFKEELDKLGFDCINIDEAHKMQWESLEGQITTWVGIFKHCYTFLFFSERKLSDSIFSEYPSISETLFSDLATAVIARFLSFGAAVALTKPSAEKLFKFLDMYETLNNLISTSNQWLSRESAQALMADISMTKLQLAEVAGGIFSDLENSIKSDQGKTPVPSGQVHPLTRYTMNYLKYACEYKDTLEEVFKMNKKMEGFLEPTNPDINEDEIEKANDDGTPKKSPFAIQLMKVMDLLDANLDMKSRLYKDLSLSYIFLMNNGRYILQKIKGSTEIHNMMGVTWCRRRSTDLRQYHKNYQRETWSKVLQCISHEGTMQANGKVIKPVLKERLKNFNALFDEIHKTQSTWVVSDEQLQSELRVSISAVVIPAYRSFMGRFTQYLEGRHYDKYVKYQAEDIEMLIHELFDGNPMSMARRRN